MATLTRITGVQNAIRRMRQRQAGYARGVEKGLKVAGALLLRKSLEVVPVDTGFLKANGFVRSDGSGFYTVVTVGYKQADYAIFVHEDLVDQAPPARAAHGQFFNVKHAGEIAAGTEHMRGPQQQAKFLEQPLNENRKAIIEIVRVYARAGHAVGTSQYGPFALPPGAAGLAYGTPGVP